MDSNQGNQSGQNDQNPSQHNNNEDNEPEEILFGVQDSPINLHPVNFDQGNPVPPDMNSESLDEEEQDEEDQDEDDVDEEDEEGVQEEEEEFHQSQINTEELMNTKQYIICHPIFQHKDDPLLGQAIQIILKYIEDQDADFAIPSLQTNMIEQIFGTLEIDAIENEFKQYNLPNSSICGKPIMPGDLYFRCLDCDKLMMQSTNMYSLQCVTCFENSNHKTHRILVVQAQKSSAYCDCGDGECYEEEGFCPHHIPSKQSRQEIIDLLPKKFFQNLNETIKKAFYLGQQKFQI